MNSVQQTQILWNDPSPDSSPNNLSGSIRYLGHSDSLMERRTFLVKPRCFLTYLFVRDFRGSCHPDHQSAGGHTAPRAWPWAGAGIGQGSPPCNFPSDRKQPKIVYRLAACTSNLLTLEQPKKV